MINPTRTALGEYLREQREARGWSVYRAAGEFGTTDTTWISWEEGRTSPKIEVLIQILQGFNAKVELPFLLNTPSEGRYRTQAA